MAADKQDKVLNVPTLRFPEFTGEWNCYRLGDLTDLFSVRNKDGKNYPMFSVTNDMGFVPQSEKFEDREMIGENINNYKVIRQGDFAYNPARINVGSIARYQEDYPCMISSLYVCFKPDEQLVNSDLLLHILKSPRLIDKYKLHGEGGVRIYLFYPNFAQIRIWLPKTNREQIKMAKLLNVIEERIATQNRIIEDLRSLKVYIHNRVFSKGNTLFGQRNTIRLADIATKITRKNKGNAINNVLSNSAAMGIVPQVEVFDKEIANEDNTSNYYVIGNGNFVYNPRKSAQAPFGPINMYKGQMEGIISPLYLCFQVTNINKNYLLHYFMSNVWYSYIYSNGDTGVRHDRVSIKDETFLDMPLYIHTVDKQQEIAKMMDIVDAKIALEELYLAKLQKQKDYLLAAMFV